MATKTTRTPITASIPAGCKISKVCSTDQTRPVLMSAYLREAKPRRFVLEATDSYCAIRLPVTVNREKGDRRRLPLTDGYVPPGALKLLDRGGTFTAANGTVEVGSPDGAGSSTYQRRNEGQWPKFDQLGFERKAKKPLRIGLDTKLLRRLAEGLGSDTVAFELDMADVKAGTYLRPYRVTPLKGEGVLGGAAGIMMPIKVGV